MYLSMRIVPLLLHTLSFLSISENPSLIPVSADVRFVLILSSDFLRASMMFVGVIMRGKLSHSSSSSTVSQSAMRSIESAIVLRSPFIRFCALPVIFRMVDEIFKMGTMPREFVYELQAEIAELSAFLTSERVISRVCLVVTYKEVRA